MFLLCLEKLVSGGSICLSSLPPSPSFLTPPLPSSCTSAPLPSTGSSGLLLSHILQPSLEHRANPTEAPRLGGERPEGKPTAPASLSLSFAICEMGTQKLDSVFSEFFHYSTSFTFDILGQLRNTCSH